MTGLDLDLSEYRILILEDSPEFQSLILQSLGQGSGHMCVDTVKDAIRVFSEQSFDCVLVDISLPDGSGFDFLQSVGDIRCPVIILSASSEIGNKALGFSMGVQDYVEKPFQPMELAIRVKSKIDFFKAQADGDMSTQLGNLSVDPLKRRVSIHIEDQVSSIELTRKELDLLNLFIKSPERVYSREQILDLIWGSDNYVLERSVDSAVAALRKKLSQWTFKVATVYGVGYSLQQKKVKKQEVSMIQNSSLLSLFETETEKQLESLSVFLQASDWDQCVKIVHKLKGSFSNFREDLSELADQIESSEIDSRLKKQIKKFLDKGKCLREEILASKTKKTA